MTQTTTYTDSQIAAAREIVRRIMAWNGHTLLRDVQRESASDVARDAIGPCPDRDPAMIRCAIALLARTLLDGGKPNPRDDYDVQA